MEACISAIRKEEAPASVNQDVAEVGARETAHFEEDDSRSKVTDAKAKHEDAMR